MENMECPKFPFRKSSTHSEVSIIPYLCLLIGASLSADKLSATPPKVAPSNRDSADSHRSGIRPNASIRLRFFV